MFGDVVTCGNNGDGCCFSQNGIKLNGKGSKNNQKMGGHDEIWHKPEMRRVWLCHKRLCVSLKGCVRSSIDGALYHRLFLFFRFILLHNIHMDCFERLVHPTSPTE